MANVETMAVSQPCNYLTEKTDCFFLWQGTVLGNIVKEFASLDIFKDKVPGKKKRFSKLARPSCRSKNLQLAAVFPHIVQTDDVRMLDQLHDYHLTLDTTRHLTSIAKPRKVTGISVHGSNTLTLDHSS